MTSPGERDRISITSLMSSSGTTGRHGLTAGESVLLLVLALIQFTHIVDFMIIMPLGPTLLREIGMSPGQFSVVVASYTVAAGLASFAVAQILDGFGRKSVLLAMYAGFILGALACAVAPSFLWLAAARALAGAFGGVAASVVFTYIGDAFAYERRGFATGVVMSAFSLASIIGVPLGIWLSDAYGWHTPFFALVGLSLPVWALACRALPAGRGHISEPGAARAPLLKLLFNPRHLRAFLLTITLVMGTFSVIPFLATFLKLNVGLSSGQLELMYVIGGASSLLVMPVTGRIADLFGKLPVYRVMGLLTVIALVLVTRLPAGITLAVTLLATTFLMIASSARAVPATAMITAVAVPAERGGFLSLNAAMQHLASGAAVGVTGLIVSQSSPDAPLEGFPLAGLVGGTATLFSLLVAATLRVAPGGIITVGELTADTPDAEVEMTASGT